MRHSTTMTTALLVALAALTGGAAAQRNDPNKIKDQLTGDAKGSAAANPQCKLYTPVGAPAPCWTMSA